MKFDKGNPISLDFFEGGGGEGVMKIGIFFWAQVVITEVKKKFDSRRLRNEVVVVVGLGTRELL